MKSICGLPTTGNADNGNDEANGSGVTDNGNDEAGSEAENDEADGSGVTEFEELEKFVYLDADVMVYDNIEELFDLSNGRFYAVMDCFCEETWSHSLQYKVKYCQQCRDRNPSPRREHGEPPAKYFNARVFVHEASKETFTPFAEQHPEIV